MSSKDRLTTVEKTKAAYLNLFRPAAVHSRWAMTSNLDCSLPLQTSAGTVIFMFS